MTNLTYDAKRFIATMDNAKRDAATIKEFMDSDIGLCAEKANRFQVGYAKVFEEHLAEIVKLVNSMKKRLEDGRI